VVAGGPAKVAPQSRRSASVFQREGEAHALADRLPDLLVEAMRVSSTVAHGIHGRRRAGPGETFWQFRQFLSSDAATLIDWRRSASSDHLYVREREWEAAHTLWLWPDLSASMHFRSHLAQVTKADRALVLMLAAAELLVRGGERVALLGLSRPTASRRATTKLAEIIATDGGRAALNTSLPPPVRISRFSGVLLFSDFLDPLEATAERLTYLAGNGVAGHLIQVMDPAEETLPYQGRTEFLGMEGSERWLADRVETLRPQYFARLKLHRAGLEQLANRLGWSFMVHHTDRPAAEPLLALIMRLQDSGRDYRWAQAAPTPGASG
jgi:uncharacterized protein (DUF58 family)